MNKKLQVFKYLLADTLSASLAWALFFVYRKVFVEAAKYQTEPVIDLNEKFWLGLFFIPMSWVLFYASTGFYNNIYRKSRLKEFMQTFVTSLVGALIIFFILILDDEIVNYKSYYFSLIAFFGFHFGLTFLFRFVITSRAVHRIHQRIIGFPTLLIGSNERALDLYKELESQKKSSGFQFVGYLHINDSEEPILQQHLTHLGHYKNAKQIIDEYGIEEVIIAGETSENSKVHKVIERLEDTEVFINIIPDMYDILAGQVKMSSIFGTPLIQVNTEIMPPFQKWFKRVFDIVASIFALLVLSPVYLIATIGVRFSSPGPIFYSHERIGLHGKPFTMYKYRSMYRDAEKNGPALSSKNDPRITPFGVFMRRTRVDELPQFWNVLKGDMSIVGPRPERRYFIDRIVKVAPHYRYLHRIKPGITSWGQVKFGYAENVDEMVQRLKYDILYLENMSLFVDAKILIYTVLIVLQGRGK